MIRPLAWTVDITWQNVTGAVAGIGIAFTLIMKWLNVRKSIGAQLAAQTVELKQHADQLYDGNRERELKQYERMFAQQEKIANQTSQLHELEESRWERQRQAMELEIKTLNSRVDELVKQQAKSNAKIEELHQLNENLQKGK